MIVNRTRVLGPAGPWRSEPQSSFVIGCLLGPPQHLNLLTERYVLVNTCIAVAISFTITIYK